MKLCRFDQDRLGVVIGDRVHDVTEAQEQIRAAARYDAKGDPVIAALPAWRSRIETMAAKAPGKPLAQVKLLSPVARPSKVMAAPTNYAKHVAEMAARRDLAADIPKRHSSKIAEAGIFLKANSSVVGPSEGVPVRFPDRRNEHELELVVIIGKQGSDIPKERALDHVAGYCLGLDMTTRGSEDRSFRKSIDGYSPLGPWMVTADEIADPSALVATLSVNGELRQTARARDLIFDIPRLIEFASSFYTLYPGDVYFTGTPEGVGPVKPGDVISAQCAPIGELKIEVRAHAAA
ncbi:MAG TPA: fumarylacetoacetate hydrolase family protein [Xanthobacteraceae bacterium]|nr:fumarylacetoacetate hydrolase family protein [Xanthobacteraceae bacterium]